MNTNVTIRCAAVADAAALAAFAERTFHDTFAADNRAEDLDSYVRKAYGVAQQTAELRDPALATLLAEVDGGLVGFAQLRAGAAPDCVTGAAPIELYRFYVDRSLHGRGVAQRLMDEVLAEVERRGAETLWLGVWERNERAKAFYRKCGFADVGWQLFVLGSDPQTDRVMMRGI